MNLDALLEEISARLGSAGWRPDEPLHVTRSLEESVKGHRRPTRFERPVVEATLEQYAHQFRDGRKLLTFTLGSAFQAVAGAEFELRDLQTKARNDGDAERAAQLAAQETIAELLRIRTLSVTAVNWDRNNLEIDPREPTVEVEYGTPRRAGDGYEMLDDAIRQFERLTSELGESAEHGALGAATEMARADLGWACAQLAQTAERHASSGRFGQRSNEATAARAWWQRADRYLDDALERLRTLAESELAPEHLEAGGRSRSAIRHAYALPEWLDAQVALAKRKDLPVRARIIEAGRSDYLASQAALVDALVEERHKLETSKSTDQSRSARTVREILETGYNLRCEGLEAALPQLDAIATAFDDHGRPELAAWLREQREQWAEAGARRDHSDLDTDSDLEGVKARIREAAAESDETLRREIASQVEQALGIPDRATLRINALLEAVEEIENRKGEPVGEHAVSPLTNAAERLEAAGRTSTAAFVRWQLSLVDAPERVGGHAASLVRLALRDGNGGGDDFKYCATALADVADRGISRIPSRNGRTAAQKQIALELHRADDRACASFVSACLSEAFALEKPQSVKDFLRDTFALAVSERARGDQPPPPTDTGAQRRSSVRVPHLPPPTPRRAETLGL